MSISETLFISGKWTDGHSHEFSSRNPAANDDILWKGAAANASDVEKAVQSAKRACATWSFFSLDERIHYLLDFKKQLEIAKDHLAEVISKETGKPMWESLTEVAAMGNKIDISIDAYSKRCAETKLESPQHFTFTRHKPHGVIAVLGPFNFPGHLPNGHIIPALLAGNTIVFKPSEYTPLVGQEITRIWEKTGLPNGVFNLIQGGSQTGKVLVSHSEIDGLFFTGSYSTGKILLQEFSKTPEKILVLELGGNNPLVISDDLIDLQAAAYATIQSAYLTSGQRCSCARRLIIPQGEKGDAFLDMLIKWIQRIKVGIYTDSPEPFMGPVIGEIAMVRLLSAQASLLGKGAKALTTMELLKENSFLLSPALIDVTTVKDRPDDEYFGPLLQVIRVDSFEKAIEEANHTAFGLTAGLFSHDKEKHRHFYQKIKAGIINWNTPLTGASSSAPFGGIGHSGNHRPSAYYAADYCAYPIASTEAEKLSLPIKLSPGIEV